MLTSPPKKGQVGDGVTFDKFKPLFEGDPYVDPFTYDRKKQREQKAKIRAGPFRPSSPPKKSSGLGNTYGCIGKPFEYMTEQSGKAREQERKPEPKNIMTNPPKKGNFGTPGIYFSDLPTSVGGSVEESKSGKRSKKPVGKPFLSTTKPLDFFDSMPNVAARKIYSYDGPLPPEKPNPSKSRDGEQKKVPFRPSSPPKQGFNSTINKFPEYIPDEYDKFKIKKKQDAEKEQPKRIWRAVSNPKSMPTRSIIFGSTL